MQLALEFIKANIDKIVTENHSHLPLNIWRELGHLGDSIGKFALDLLVIPGTVGEKRNIAALLRQLQRKNALPEKIPGSNANEAAAQLQELAQPRRTAVLEKFDRALGSSGLPAGSSIRIDPTLSQPGLQISMNLNRRHTDRLLEMKTAVEKIFTEVEEL
jgi:hypothetical protein